jgi:hypothetical protein
VTPAFVYGTDRKQFMVEQDYSSIKKKFKIEPSTAALEQFQLIDKTFDPL